MRKLCLCLALAAISMVAAAEDVQWTKTELYLGQNLGGTRSIAPDKWDSFLDRVVTPKFRKGLTVIQAYGQMQHESGSIEKQTTLVLQIVHPADEASEAAIQEIIKAFRDKFRGAQVMHLSSPVKPEFFAD